MGLLQLRLYPTLALSSQLFEGLKLVDGYDCLHFVEEVPSVLLHDLLLSVNLVEGLRVGLSSYYL